MIIKLMDRLIFLAGVQSPTVVQVIQPTARPTGNNSAPASAYPQSAYPPAYPSHQQHTGTNHHTGSETLDSCSKSPDFD